MQVPQLTLYDFLADFLPGAVALGLLSTILWLAGSSGPPLTASTGIVIVVTSYPVGRSIHAVAGQAEIKELRKQTFDNFVFALESTRHNASLIDSDVAVREEPSVVERLNSVHDSEESDGMLLNDWIDKEVVDTFTASDNRESCNKTTNGISDSSAVISTADIDWGEKSFGQLQRFGFSELFDKSTLYQRYNILETFYRNLWLVSTYFSLLFLTIGFAGIFASVPLLIRLAIIAVTIAILFISILPYIILYSSAFPWWYLLTGLLISIIIFIFPTYLLSTQTSDPMTIDGILFGSVGLILLIFAILFDIRRLQFKDRQVRAFINDIYRQQQTSNDERISAGR